MRRKLRKLISMLLVAAMTLGLCATSLAAEGECTITIENSVKGNTYYAYLIFDATYDEDSQAVSYTMKPDSAWASLILSAEGQEYFKAQPVYEAGYSAESDDAGNHIAYYNITMADGASEADLITWLTGCITVDESTGLATLGNGLTIEPGNEDGAEGNDGTIKIEGLDPGYYFVSTTNGSTVSVTTAAPDATVIDKNQTPGDLHKYLVDDDGEIHESVEEGMDGDVSFDIIAHVPLYDGDKVVTEYVFTDTLSNGLLIELTDGQFTTKTTTDGTIYVLTDAMINEWITLGDGTDNFTDQVYDYTFELLGYDTYTDTTTGETYHTFSGFVLTFYTYDTSAYVEGDEDTFDTSKYPVNADIEIKYTAHVSSLEGYDNTNDIEMMWYVTSWDHPTPEESTPGLDTALTDHNDVYSWELELYKVDAAGDRTPLEGAEFTLESDNMQSIVVGHSYLYVLVSGLENAVNGVITDEDGNSYNVVDFETTDYYKQEDGSFGITETDDGPYHRILTDKQTTVTESTHLAQGTTDSSGKIYFAGLGSGDYTLTEITAPEGYNILTDPISFTINWTEEGGFTVTMKSTGVTSNMSDSYVLTLTIENNAGTELPSTGGMGTTIFYIVGIVLMVCAAAAFVARKRLEKHE